MSSFLLIFCTSMHVEYGRMHVPLCICVYVCLPIYIYDMSSILQPEVILFYVNYTVSNIRHLICSICGTIMFGRRVLKPGGVYMLVSTSALFCIW